MTAPPTPGANNSDVRNSSRVRSSSGAPVSDADPSAGVSNWNLPNAITVTRILAAPVFVWMLLVDNGADGPLRWFAALLFILALASDGIDGAIARKHGLVTDLGKILDPVADKIATGGALVALSILGELPWWVTALILVREIGITLWRLVELKQGRVIPASRGGKLKTVTQVVALSFALLPLWTVLGDWINVVNIVTMSLAVVVTLVTGAEYLWQSWRHTKTRTSA